MVPIELTQYAKRPHAINVINITKIFSYTLTGHISPYPIVIIVIVEKYIEFIYLAIQSS